MGRLCHEYSSPILFVVFCIGIAVNDDLNFNTCSFRVVIMLPAPQRRIRYERIFRQMS